MRLSRSIYLVLALVFPVVLAAQILEEVFAAFFDNARVTARGAAVADNDMIIRLPADREGDRIKGCRAAMP